jgi:hypothetical protein
MKLISTTCNTGSLQASTGCFGLGSLYWLLLLLLLLFYSNAVAVAVAASVAAVLMTTTLSTHSAQPL